MESQFYNPRIFKNPIKKLQMAWYPDIKRSRDQQQREGTSQGWDQQIFISKCNESAGPANHVSFKTSLDRKCIFLLHFILQKQDFLLHDQLCWPLFSTLNSRLDSIGRWNPNTVPQVVRWVHDHPMDWSGVLYCILHCTVVLLSRLFCTVCTTKTDVASPGLPGLPHKCAVMNTVGCVAQCANCTGSQYIIKAKGLITFFKRSYTKLGVCSLAV